MIEKGKKSIEETRKTIKNSWKLMLTSNSEFSHVDISLIFNV